VVVGSRQMASFDGVLWAEGAVAARMSGVPGGGGDAAPALHGWPQWLTSAAGVVGGATLAGDAWGPGALTAGVGQLA
jgi:hypothetical protein